MSTQTYLIDTNVIIHLEDNNTVEPAFSALKVSPPSTRSIFSSTRPRATMSAATRIWLAEQYLSSKLGKFQTISKVRGLTSSELSKAFGPLPKHNDIVDATLLHALHIGAVDFLGQPR